MRKFAALILSIFISTLIFSQNVSEQTERKQKIEEEISYLDKQLAATKTRKQSNTKELNYIQRKISNRKKLLREIETRLRVLTMRFLKRSSRSQNWTEVLNLSRDHILNWFTAHIRTGTRPSG